MTKKLQIHVENGTLLEILLKILVKATFYIVAMNTTNTNTGATNYLKHRQKFNIMILLLRMKVT